MQHSSFHSRQIIRYTNFVSTPRFYNIYHFVDNQLLTEVQALLLWSTAQIIRVTGMAMAARRKTELACGSALAFLCL